AKNKTEHFIFSDSPPQPDVEVPTGNEQDNQRGLFLDDNSPFNAEAFRDEPVPADSPSQAGMGRTASILEVLLVAVASHILLLGSWCWPGQARDTCRGITGAEDSLGTEARDNRDEVLVSASLYLHYCC
ncbi:unnamed protein product, partial [Symbiodinium natans]